VYWSGQYKTGINARETLEAFETFANDMLGGVITMEDKNGRSALSQGAAVVPTKVKATLASIPIATESLVSRRISSTLLLLYYS